MEHHAEVITYVAARVDQISEILANDEQFDDALAAALIGFMVTLSILIPNSAKAQQTLREALEGAELMIETLDAGFDEAIKQGKEQDERTT